MKSKPKKRILIFDPKGVAAFAQQFKEVRSRLDISQEELSNKSGITLSTIARIETARINPTLSTILALARGLDIDLKELFDFEYR